MQIHKDIRVLLLLAVFFLPGLIIAGTDSGQVPGQALTETDIPVLVGDKKEEIDRLQQDIAASKAEKESINKQNERLQNKMQNLMSRIQELKNKLLEEYKAADAPALK